MDLPFVFVLISLTKKVISTMKVDADACVELPLLVTVPNWPKNTGEEPMYGVTPEVTFKPEMKKNGIS
jgi:hypothetical protein